MRQSVIKVILSSLVVPAAAFSFGACNDSDQAPPAAHGPAPEVSRMLVAPKMGVAQNFSILAGSAVSNTGATTVAGEVGVSPGNSLSGFPAGALNERAVHLADLGAAQAQRDAAVTYGNLAGQACSRDLSGSDLGGMTLAPGVYCFSGAAQLTGALTLDAQGDPNALFLFKVGSTFVAAANSAVYVINRGVNCNVFWQVGDSASIGAGTAFIGNVFAMQGIAFEKSATLSGRAMARNGAVTLDTNSVALAACPNSDPEPTPSPAPTPEPTPTPTPTPCPCPTPTSAHMLSSCSNH